MAYGSSCARYSAEPQRCETAMRQLTIEETQWVTGGAGSDGSAQAQSGDAIMNNGGFSMASDMDGDTDNKKSRKDPRAQMPERDTNPLPIG